MKKLLVVMSSVLLVLVTVIVCQGVAISRLKKDFVEPVNKYKCIEVIEDNIYITTNSDSLQVFSDYMKQEGFEYVPEEQLGAFHPFEKDGVITYYGNRHYKNYVLWVNGNYKESV